MELSAESRETCRLAAGKFGNGKQHGNIMVYLPSVGGQPLPSGSASPAYQRPVQAGSPFSANHLLARLTSSDLCYLEPYLCITKLSCGEILSEFCEQPERIWFPETCVVSLVVGMSTGHDITVGLVGREGVVSDCVARHVVQVAGNARFLSMHTKSAALDATPALGKLLLRYADALHGQVMQGAACNALHSVEARLARFLLSVADRLQPYAPLPLTQEDLAQALGVGRSTVNKIATAFQREGLITYRRGAVQIQNRRGLKAAACECYDVVRSYYMQLLGDG